jgi:hypothetical protein
MYSRSHEAYGDGGRHDVLMAPVVTAMPKQTQFKRNVTWVACIPIFGIFGVFATELHLAFMIVKEK